DLAIPLAAWSDLAALAPSVDFGAAIPPQIPQSQGLEVTGLAVTFAPQMETLVAVTVVVSLGIDWSSIPPIVLQSIAAAITVSFTPSTSITAIVTTAITIEDATIDVSVSLPDLLVSGELTSGTLSLTSLIAAMVPTELIPAAGLPALDILGL